MTYTTLYYQLLEIIDGELIKQNEWMKNHTYFKIGGPASILVEPQEVNQVQQIIHLCKEHDFPFYIMGNGSNILVDDHGIEGVVIKLSKQFSKIEIDGNTIKAQAGALLSSISKKALKDSLTGFEFAGGIPGTIGGALMMNAGAYGGEMKHVVKCVKALTPTGEIIELSNEMMAFDYRHSILKDKNYIALEAVIELEKGNYDAIKAIMDDLNEKRITKQPLSMPSAGSTFKRPVGHYASKLIDDAGLKGLSFGGAQVSKKHSGFIVNYDNATCEDVLTLMGIIKKIVFDKYNVALEAEVKRFGRS